MAVSAGRNHISTSKWWRMFTQNGAYGMSGFGAFSSRISGIRSNSAGVRFAMIVA